MKMGSISQFIDRHFRHFNAAGLKDAADAYITHLDRGGKMMITLAAAILFLGLMPDTLAARILAAV